MHKKVIAIFLSFLFVFLLLPAPSVQAANTFDVEKLHARYAILVNANDPSKALFGIEKNADAKCSTGSTIKILTCLLAIESGKMDEVATVSDNAVNFNKKYNSLMGLEAGEKWKISDLLYGLMLPSGNDAAIAIAEHIAGSTSAFAKMMNEKAQKLGMTHSHFTTVHGKDDGTDDAPKNYSTARDMAILTAEALKNPVFREIVLTPVHDCADLQQKHNISLQNTNRLLIDAESDGTYTPISCLYKSAIGVKTGDTNRAGKCFVAAAEQGGITLIAVLLGGTLDDDYYTKNSKNMNAAAKDPYNAQRFQDAIDLFTFGFENMSHTYTLEELTKLGLPVSFTKNIPNAAEGDSELTVSTRFDDSDKQMKFQIMDPLMEQLQKDNRFDSLAEVKIGTLVAPITANKRVGSVTYHIGDGITFDLFADRDVMESVVAAKTEPSSQEQVNTPLLGKASTLLTGEPVKESHENKTKTVIIIVIVVLLVLLAVAFVVLLIVARIRRERRRKAKAAARRRRRLQQERIARQRAAELDRRK